MNPRPVVWASVYPESQDDFPNLKQALGRLRLSDSSFSYEEESSGTLGRGFRCGFLGMSVSNPTFNPTGLNPNAWGIPVRFSFSSSGGSGSYQWTNVQTGNVVGQVGYSTGIVLPGNQSISESLDFASGGNPPSSIIPTGSSAVLFDAPGQAAFQAAGRVTSLVVVFTFQLQVTVSSGGQTIQCPTVNWQAVTIWRGNDRFGTAYQLPF